MSDRELDRIMKSEQSMLLEQLGKEPRVPVYLPSSEYGNGWTGYINGVPVVLGTDQQIDVPVSVYHLICSSRTELSVKAQTEREWSGSGKKLAEYE